MEMVAHIQYLCFITTAGSPKGVSWIIVFLGHVNSTDTSCVTRERNPQEIILYSTETASLYFKPFCVSTVCKCAILKRSGKTYCVSSWRQGGPPRCCSWMAALWGEKHSNSSSFSLDLTQGSCLSLSCHSFIPFFLSFFPFMTAHKHSAHAVTIDGPGCTEIAFVFREFDNSEEMDTA